MRMRILLSLTALAVVCASPCEAQVNIKSETKLSEFKELHPQARFYGQQYYYNEGFFEIDGTANYIYGTTLANGNSPMASAWNLCGQLEGVYAQELGKLIPGSEIGVMWDKKTNSHRFTTFRFQQTVAGIPVYKSGIGFLVRNEENFPIVLASNNFKEMLGFDAAAAANIAPKATEQMLANVGEMMKDAPAFQGGPKLSKSVMDNRQDLPLPAVTASEEQLVIWAGVTNVAVENPELAIAFIAERGAGDVSTHQKHLIIASVENGEILHSVNQISADVVGTVSGQASDGVAALECHPEATFALPYAQIDIVGGGTVFADEDGNFNAPSGNGNVTVRSPLRGQYFEVFDDTIGGNTPSIDINVASPGSVDILHNPNATEFATSNVNCYVHANIVRDFVLSFEPNFPTIAGQTFFDITSNNDVIGNITSCNATYNGFAINFMRNTGSCNNTSIPDVVYHEYGHHLVNVTGNSQGQFGEGSGDVMGVLIEDNPDLALGFFEGDCGNGIRSANNFRTYPCDGGIHDCGQLIAGCVWDTINELRAVDPENARDITAALYMGMLIVRGQTGGSSMIGPEITLIMLELDDNDLSIGNGTPHYDQIAAAFNAHNMMAPELDAIAISFRDEVPTTIAPSGGSFLVDVEGISGTPVPGSGTLHYNAGNGFTQVPMTVVDADTYEAVFPAFDCGSTVEFFLSAQANGAGTITNPCDAPVRTYTLVATLGSENQSLESFDTDSGWTVSGDATDGEWQRGIPNNGDRGDPSFDAEDIGSEFCFVTDNGNTPGDDNTDVDGGSTTLTSPILDASTSGDGAAVLSYYRWYSNNFGNAPNADIFVVEISNDGGSSWVNLETVGPSGPEVVGGWIFTQFLISDTIAPTNNMRVRFTASDLGDGSVVEAGVDAVSIDIIQCSKDSCTPGDVNMDGEINLLDVVPFIDVLGSGEFLCEADINDDGSVDLLDVNGFIDLLGS